MKKIIVTVVFVTVFGAGVLLVMVAQRDDRHELLVEDPVVSIWKTPRPLSPFLLRDYNGKPFDLSRFRGKWSLVYFGYTNCPDICPTSLTMLNRLYQELSKSPDRLQDTQFLFITVDPKRDSITRLNSYVRYFNKDFVGITGDAAEIAKLARQVGARYEVLDRGNGQNYVVNHSASVYIIDKRGRFIALMPPPLDPVAMARKLATVRQQGAR